MKFERLTTILKSNPKRVVCRSFNISGDNVRRISSKIAAYSNSETEKAYKEMMLTFTDRHRDLNLILDERYSDIKSLIPKEFNFSEAAQKLLSSYFCMEYSFEAAALFNPSIVAHPEYQGDSGDALRFILSLRATGEGHISSAEYIAGSYDLNGQIILDPISKYAAIPKTISRINENTVELEFDRKSDLSERIIFPVTSDESNGIEDVRMVQFVESDQPLYFGTYTAYDGRQIRSKILETSDFIRFRLHTLNGRAISDKGMALFPEKIDGKYAMISRQDGDNLRIMFSDDLFYWDESEVIAEPDTPWELVKVGNCGSPLKTDSGWILLTHGVGPLRKYCIGASLLDQKNPKKVLARLKEPLIVPNSSEREGYVPNVVYSCGGIIHDEWLLLPYAMSDSATGFGRVRVDQLLAAME